MKLRCKLKKIFSMVVITLFLGFGFGPFARSNMNSIQLTSTPGYNEIILQWTPHEEATDYMVFLYKEDGNTIPLFDFPTNIFTYTHTNLSETKEYCYIVVAYNYDSDRIATSNKTCAQPLGVPSDECKWTDVGTISILGTSSQNGRWFFRFLSCSDDLFGKMLVDPDTFYATNNPSVSLRDVDNPLGDNIYCIRLCLDKENAILIKWELVKPDPVEKIEDCCSSICGCMLQITAPEGSVAGAEGVTLTIKFQDDCCGGLLEFKMDGSLKAFNSGTGKAFVNPNAVDGTYSILEYQYAYPQGTTQCSSDDSHRRWCMTVQLAGDGVTIIQWEMHPEVDPCCDEEGEWSEEGYITTLLPCGDIPPVTPSPHGPWPGCDSFLFIDCFENHIGGNLTNFHSIYAMNDPSISLMNAISSNLCMKIFTQGSSPNVTIITFQIVYTQCCAGRIYGKIEGQSSNCSTTFIGIYHKNPLTNNFKMIRHLPVTWNSGIGSYDSGFTLPWGEYKIKPFQTTDTCTYTPASQTLILDNSNPNQALLPFICDC